MKIKCLLLKHEEPSLDTQHCPRMLAVVVTQHCPRTLAVVVHTCSPSRSTESSPGLAIKLV